MIIFFLNDLNWNSSSKIFSVPVDGDVAKVFVEVKPILFESISTTTLCYECTKKLGHLIEKIYSLFYSKTVKLFGTISTIICLQNWHLISETTNSQCFSFQKFEVKGILLYGHWFLLIFCRFVYFFNLKRKQTFFSKRFQANMATPQTKANISQQCCPTLSPLAPCGDKKLRCGDRLLFRNGFLMVNSLHIFQILTKLATAKPLLPQLWQIRRQRECGWIPLFYRNK